MKCGVLFWCLFLLAALQLSAQSLDDILAKVRKSSGPVEEIAIYQTAIRNSQPDEHRKLGTIYFNLGTVYLNQGKKDSSITAYYKAASHLLHTKNEALLGNTYNNLIYAFMPNTDSAFHYARLALIHRRKSGDSAQVAHSQIKLGDLYESKAQFSKAIDKYLIALRIFEFIHDTVGLIHNYNDIAVLYGSIDDKQKRKSYLIKTVKLLESTTDSIGIGTGYNNLANFYTDVGMLDSSAYYQKMALSIRKRHADDIAIASSKYNLAQVYHSQNKCNEALPLIQEATDFFENNDTHIANLYCYEMYSRILDCLGQTSAAEQYLLKSLKYSDSVYDLQTRNAILDAASRHYALTGKHKLAYKYRLEYEAAKDSLLNEEKLRSVERLEAQFNLEKRQLEIENLKQEKAIQEQALEISSKNEEQQRLIIYASIGGLLLVIVFSIIIGRRLRISRDQNRLIQEQKVEVEYQKELVEDKNREIIDSIQYAKRLQEAILPPAKIVKEWLQESFILYKPKDIVAGDFYWMESVPGQGKKTTPKPSQKEGNRNSVQQGLPDGEELGGTIYFAAADCTGHGVPGAMVSVVCSNALSKALVEEKITDPGKLLDRTRELVIDRFGKSEEEIKDGMDIALVSLAQRESESGERSLQYAGANNPLWIIRKGADEVEEIKADKQPIGKYAAEKPFTTHEVQLNKGDAIYIFSDGYVDQFGGVKGKKYKSGNLKKFLLSIRDHDMTTQRELLHEEFENWKGDIGQIDDVCLIGVKV